MKIAMLGLAGAGKKTLFQLMTGAQARAISAKGVPGVFQVVDPRVDILSGMYKPEKTIYARQDVVLLPDVENTRGKAPWLEEVRTFDGILVVVRAFEDPSVAHPAGSVDPVRDLDTFFSELLFADMVLADRRKERLREEMGKGKGTPEKEKELKAFEKVSAALEAGTPFRSIALGEPERAALQNTSFLTGMPIAGAVNLTQGADAAGLQASIEAKFKGRLTLSFFDAKLEMEIAAIEDPAERREFLTGMGIQESAVAKLTRSVYDALGLMSFFTVGEDEVRAWTIRKGSLAPQAARAIHKDLEKGFIRAEVMKYKDLVELGGEAKVQEAGKFSLKGKDYVVEEGDIVHIRASA